MKKEIFQTKSDEEPKEQNQGNAEWQELRKTKNRNKDKQRRNLRAIPDQTPWEKELYAEK